MNTIIKIKYIEYLVLILWGMLYFKKYGGAFFNFIPVLGYGVLIILLSIFITIQKKDKFYFDKSFIVLAFIWIMLLSSFLWTNSLGYGGSKIFHVLFGLILFYSIAPIIFNNFKFFLFSQIFFYFLYLFNLYIEYGFITELLAQVNAKFRLGWDEDSSSVFHPIGISRYISLSMISIFFIAYIWIKEKKKYLLIILSILMMYGIIFLFFSGTRTPILALFISIIALVFLNKFISLKTKAIILSIPIIFLLLINLLLSIDFGLTKSQRDFIQYRYNDPKAAVSDRGWQFERATSKIDEKMMIFGKGTGDFSYEFYKSDERQYPHNIFTEVFFENGILTVFAIFILLYVIAKVNIKSKSIKINYMLISFYFALVNAMFSGDLISNNIVFGYFIVVILFNKYEQEILINKEIDDIFYNNR